MLLKENLESHLNTLLKWIYDPSETVGQQSKMKIYNRNKNKNDDSNRTLVNQNTKKVDRWTNHFLKNVQKKTTKIKKININTERMRREKK